ncbi:unnamed protein product [Amoebophrya sp. A25]|nr:unnamed protein product [Amoebophrya sp. A25]|eukprot:GSA25T00008216001.1
MKASSSSFGTSFQKGVCTNAVLRPIASLLSLLFVLVFFTALAFLTRNAYPDADFEQTQSVDIWRVRDHPIMQRDFAFRAATARSRRWLDADQKFETEKDRVARRLSRDPVAVDPAVASALLGTDGEPAASNAIGGSSQIVYKTKSGSKVFTPANLRAICRLERLWHEYRNLLTDADKWYDSVSRLSRYVQLSAIYGVDAFIAALQGHVNSGNSVSTFIPTGTAKAALRAFPPSQCEVAMTDAQADALIDLAIYQEYRSATPTSGATGSTTGTSSSSYGFFLDRGFAARGYATQTRSGFIGVHQSVTRDEAGEALDALAERLDEKHSLFSPRFLGANVDGEQDEDEKGSWAVLPGTDGNVLVRAVDRNLKEIEWRIFLRRDLMGLPIALLLVWAVVCGITGGSTWCASIVILFVGCGVLSGFVGYFLFARLAFFELFMLNVMFVMLAVGADDFFVMFEAVKLERARAAADAPQALARANGGATGLGALEAVGDTIMRNGDNNAQKMKQIEAPSSPPGTIILAQTTTATTTTTPQQIVPESESDLVLPPAVAETQDEKVVAAYLALFRGTSRASSSILETSLTTALAFFSMLTSTVIPVAHFGAFAGLMILGAFLFGVTAFPCVIGAYILHMESKQNCFSLCGCFFSSSQSSPRGGGFLARLEGKKVLDEERLVSFGSSVTGAPMSQSTEPGNDSGSTTKNNLLQDIELGSSGHGRPVKALMNGSEIVEPNKVLGNGLQHQQQQQQLPVTTSSTQQEEQESDKLQLFLARMYDSFIAKPMSFDLTKTTKFTIYPIASAVILLFTSLSIWLAVEAGKLKEPTEVLEMLPEKHMMVGLEAYSRKAFLSSGAASAWRKMHIVWGIDRDTPVKNEDTLSRWTPWEWSPNPSYYLQNSGASLVDNSGTSITHKSVTAPESVRHILRVGERLANLSCDGKAVCANKAAAAGKLFVPGTLTCGIRDTLHSSSLVTPRRALDENAGVQPQNKQEMSLLSKIFSRRKTSSVTSSSSNQCMSQKYYNVPTTDLLSDSFNYRSSPLVRNPFFPTSSSSSGSLTPDKLVAESFYRSQRVSWGKKAHDASVLSPFMHGGPRGGANAQVDWHAVGTVAHPGSSVYADRVFDWNAGFWQQADYLVYSLSLGIPLLGDLGESYEEADSLYHAVEAVLEEENARAPATLGPAMQQTDYFFYVIAKELKTTLYGGLALLFPICFLLLLFASMNVVTAFWSIFTVAATVFQVLGTFNLMGWELGSLETMAGILVIGLAVDYTLHFAHVYTEAGRSPVSLHSSEQRVRYALAHMGSTIFAGFASSAVAGLCLLLFCMTPPFNRVSVTIFLTVLYALIMSMVYLPCILIQLGPTGEKGELLPLWEKIRGIKNEEGAVEQPGAIKQGEIM